MSSTTAILLYLVLTLGAAAVYFLLPTREARKPYVGAVLGVASIVALLVVLATRVVVPPDGAGSASSSGSAAYFYLFAAIAIAAAARVVTHPKPVYSALYFVLLVIAVAALLVLRQSEFLAIALIIVYAGAILVTYLFVMMLAQQQGAPTFDVQAREPFMAVLCAFVLIGAILGRATELPPADAPRAVTVADDASTAPGGGLSEGNTLAIGRMVMTRYIVVLEMAGVLLLISMVGAVALARKKAPADGYQPAARSVGQIGKEVPPF